MIEFDRMSGRVATPDAADWDEARAAWNLAADQRPEAVVFAQSAADVADAVGFAADRGLRVAVQGTGHGAAALPPLEGAVLVRTDGMRGVTVDPEGRTARVEAGVLATELGAAAGEHGLSALPGSSPDVGVVGYTLGGGLSWLGRRHGLACNSVREIELVTAAGESMTVDAERAPDLFWALRGGGGGVAAVTALRVELFELAEVYAGALVFPAALGGEAIRAYRDWTETIGEDVTSVIRFLTPPDLPDVPEPLRGQRLLTISVACIGDPATAEATISPLRAIGQPVLDTIATIPAADLSRIHMDPEQPVPGIGDGMTLTALPDEAIEAFVALDGPDSGSPLLLSELRHLGGALGRAPQGAGALAKLDAGFAMACIGIPATPELGAAIPSHLDRIERELAPWAAPGSYFNFSERRRALEEILPADVCERLAAVRREWDPGRVFVARHEPPA